MIFRAIGILFSVILIAGLLMLSGCITLTPLEITSTTPAITTDVVTQTPTDVIDPSWTPPAPVSSHEPLPSIADVVAAVKPSVVSISVQVPVQGFFGSTLETGSGSGWILDSNGIIVTNNHVVEGANAITVTLDDGRVFEVQSDTVFTDPTTDLAILKIDAAGLPELGVGDSSALRVGDWVVAIGNSLGLGTRATVGIVSQLDVSLQVSTQTLYNLIDTSAVINPGNSGGPLVSLSGEVIGITSAKIVATGAEATGFAISMEQAAPIIQELINNGYVVRPFLGVQGLITMDQSVASYYRLSMIEGVLVRGVLTDSPAQVAGLKAGDIITSIGGQSITTVEQLTRILHSSNVGEPLQLKYYRDGSETTTDIVPVESPPPTFN